MVRLQHIPALFIGTAFTFGGLIPLYSPTYGIQKFGLPDRIATSKTAHPVIVIYGARATALGVVIYTLYARRQYAAIDTILASLTYIGLVDGYVCWSEGENGNAIFRTVFSMVVAGCGWLGLTAKN